MIDAPPLAFVNARLLDGTGIDRAGGLLMQGGRISAVGDIEIPDGVPTIDSDGLTLCPGLIDSRVFRIDVAAATAGGVTRLCLMPDQSPTLDDPAMIERVLRLGQKRVWVHPLAAATTGLEGDAMAEVGLCLAAGAVAISTGRAAIRNAAIMLRLLQYARGFDALVVSHAEEPDLVADTVATDGEVATRLGLASHPAIAECLMVARDIRLAEHAGARLHIAQVTTAESIALVRAAKARGAQVTCGVTPAHLLLNEHAAYGYRTYARLSPPLRSEADRLATVAGVRDGTIDVIASGHDPRTEEDKRLPFGQAEPGMVGVETLLPLALTLAHNADVDLKTVLAAMTANPARIFRVPGGVLAAGAPADAILIDPDAAGRIDASALASPARNTPFDGLPVYGRLHGVWQAGRQIFGAF